MTRKIEWTDETWNPVRGRLPCDPGCLHCYAMRQAHRFSGPGKPYEGLTKLGGKGPVWTGDSRLVPEKLSEPLHWREPRTVFVNSMSDLFWEEVPNEYIAAVFGVMAACPQHTFQILTKRADRMRRWFEWIAQQSSGSPVAIAQAYAFVQLGPDVRLAVPNDCPWPLPNVLLGVSVSNQEGADERIPHLLQTPAAKRFVSYEPALGPVDFSYWLKGISHCGACEAENPIQEEDRCPSCGAEGLIDTWGEEQAERYRTGERYDSSSPAGVADVAGKTPTIAGIIIGAESGNGARPFDEAWARSTRDICDQAGATFFYKQRLDGRTKVSLPILDGRQHTAMPEVSRSVVHSVEAWQGAEFQCEAFAGDFEAALSLGIRMQTATPHLTIRIRNREPGAPTLWQGLTKEQHARVEEALAPLREPPPAGVHLDSAVQQIPNGEPPREGLCPRCGLPAQHGYGLTGGGFGEYWFCETEGCDWFFKVQDAEVSR